MPMWVEGTSCVTEYANIFLNLQTQLSKQFSEWVSAGSLRDSGDSLWNAFQLNRQLIWNEQSNQEQIHWFQLLKLIALWI